MSVHIQQPIYQPVTTQPPVVRQGTAESLVPTITRASFSATYSPAAPHLSPCVCTRVCVCVSGKHVTEKTCGAHTHSFRPAHESLCPHLCSHRPGVLGERGREMGGRMRRSVGGWSMWSVIAVLHVRTVCVLSAYMGVGSLLWCKVYMSDTDFIRGKKERERIIWLGRCLKTHMNTYSMFEPLTVCLLWTDELQLAVTLPERVMKAIACYDMHSYIP